MMDDFKMAMDELNTDQKIKLLLIQEIANGVIAPIITRVCILYLFTLIVWAFK